MIKKIKEAKLSFITEQNFHKRDAEKLRGFFANKFKDEDYFHNHREDGTDIYRMPLIQYKVIDGLLVVYGYNDAIQMLSDKFLKVDKIILGNQTINHFETNLAIAEKDFFVDDNLFQYIFDSYWLAVNQKNYLKYINNRLNLNKVLQNNILTNFKGLGIRADKKIMVNGEYNEKSVMINNIEYFGFKGKFTTNVVMPDCFGIGKFKAVGFGVVRRNWSDKEDFRSKKTS